MFYIFLLLLIISIIILCYTIKDNFSNIPRWSEISRSKKFYSTKTARYPPCFEKSKDAQEIYNIITKSQNLFKYYGLFNTLSIVLCQLSPQNNFKNTNGYLEDRLKNLLNIGAVENQNAKDIVNKYDIKDQNIKKLLIMSTSLLEHDIQLASSEKEISEEDKKKLRLLINNFYTDIYSKF